ncbi:hypothetical protein COO60DRAFT_1640125 [Scenedesmus sp. NREL 46B-D3]|nr:hypothetical protein COO60DRAFT_1640125 [Scenedesmus sp. NREL 46B-D3]
MADKQKYVPLNVKTYREGFLRLQGWTVFSCIAFFTAGLLVIYELLVINVEDQDFRDMLFDYRITREGINYQHKHFANAYYCCSQDSAVYSYTCPRPPANYSDYWGSETPPCPPTVQFTCPDLASSSCNKVRAAVYPAAGLDTTGRVVSCSRAGQVLLRGRSGSGYWLTASAQGSQLSQQLALDPDRRAHALAVTCVNAWTALGTGWMRSCVLLQAMLGQGARAQASPDATQAGIIDTGQVDAFVARVAAAHSDPMFVLPSEPLGRSLRVNNVQDPTADKWGDFGWPWELWPWPPAAACSHTGQPAVMHLGGVHKANFASYEPATGSSPPTLAVTLLGNALSVPQYQLLPAVQQGAGAAATAAAGAAAGNNSDIVAVNALTGMKLTVGLLPQLGACRAWQLLRPALSLEYSKELWRGTAQELAALRKPITAGSQSMTPTVRGVPDPLPHNAGSMSVTLSVHDVAEPLPLALPRYSGELYVYVALVLGGVWMFSTAPLIVMFGVVLINVQRNRGLPTFFYRYMRKYRGW